VTGGRELGPTRGSRRPGQGRLGRRLLGALGLWLLAGCATANSQTAETDDAKMGAPLAPSPMGHYLAGRYATEQRDVGAAAELLGVALQADPGNTELLRQTYLVMVSDGRMEEAAALAQRLIDAGIEDSPARLTLALRSVKTGDFVAAREHLKKLPTDGFNSFVIPLLEGWVLLETDGVDAALAAIEPLAKMRGLEPVRGIHVGLIAERGGRPEVAAKGYQSAVEVAASPPFRMVEIIGNYYQRTGRRDDAAALYAGLGSSAEGALLAQQLEARLDEEHPAPVIETTAAGLAEVLFDAASILRQEHVTDVSLIYVRMALDLQPDLAIAQLLVADILEEQGRHDAAIEAYRAVPKEAPLSWQARLSLADLLDRRERTDEAIVLLKDMTAERPGQVDAPMQLGNIYRIHQRFPEAAEAYDIAVSRLGNPTADRWALFYFRGIAYERSGQWQKAEADFLKALELSPDHPYVLNYLAYSWIEQGVNYDKALEMLKHAVTLRPDDGFIIDSLGWVYYRLGKYDLAVQQLERANELLPTDPVLNDHLGDAYWRVGRHNEARFQWRRALQFNPEADQIPHIQAKIDAGLQESPPPVSDRSGS
jgi:tetratricopeptide (TPR) repeat protein